MLAFCSQATYLSLPYHNFFRLCDTSGYTSLRRHISTKAALSTRNRSSRSHHSPAPHTSHVLTTHLPKVTATARDALSPPPQLHPPRHPKRLPIPPSSPILRKPRNSHLLRHLSQPSTSRHHLASNTTQHISHNAQHRFDDARALRAQSGLRLGIRV
jgi:hypothetical protein